MRPPSRMGEDGPPRVRRPVRSRRVGMSERSPTPPPPTGDALESRSRAIGRALFGRIGRGPKPWRRAWWDDRLMAVSMGDEATKVQLFRFIDALPTLTEPRAARRHLAEYLDEAGP